MRNMGFNEICQVIGVAYTYPSSRVLRNRLSVNRPDHSSHDAEKNFSYFKKVDVLNDMVLDGGHLRLTRHFVDGFVPTHWSEPELVIVLGNRHEITGICLGNDFTAYTIEFSQLPVGYDPTYYGKCWPGSCSLGPRLLSPSAITDINELEIKITVNRNSETIQDGKYSTRSRIREFQDIPKLIVSYFTALMVKFSSFDQLPKSKQIEISKDGFLPFGTAILTGTGMVKANGQYDAAPGDVVAISSKEIGKLTNTITD